MRAPIPQILSWPLDGVDADGRYAHAADDRSIRQVMLNILLTRPGERLMRPEFGAGLPDFVHEPNNETTRRLMADVARKSIEQWEPRVVLESVSADADSRDPARVHLTVRYRLRHAVAPNEFSLSLSLAGGT